MARQVPLSGMRRGEGLAGRAPVAMCGLRAADLGDCGHDSPGHAYSADGLVSGDVGRDRTEGRDECPHLAPALGAGQLSDGMDVGAQAPARHGAPGTGTAGGPRRSRRDVRRRGRGRRRRTRGREESADCRRRRIPRPENRPHSPAAGARRLGTACKRSSTTWANPAAWCTPMAGWGTTGSKRMATGIASRSSATIPNRRTTCCRGCTWWCPYIGPLLVDLSQVDDQ